jgi:radical SAM superfamily enzyme YgiQ (UPF0313 family)
MKVLFANPPWWEGVEKHDESGEMRWRCGVRAGSRWPHTILVQSAPDKIVYKEYLPYPFFLGFAATYAQRETDAEVTFRDSIALRESYEKFYAHVEEAKYDYIFIETATPSWAHDLGVMRKLKTILPDAKIVVTGPIVNSPAELKQADGVCHAAIKGEYEKGSVRVLSGESGIIDYDMLTTEEMNSQPFPYMDRTYANLYWDGVANRGTWPILKLWGSRGCPYKCIFCVWPATMTGNDPDGTKKRYVRHYNGRYIEAWIRHYLSIAPFTFVYFDDDTFNLGQKHVLDVCDSMERIGMPWGAMCRADTIDNDGWLRMKETGCVAVKLGFESGNQWVVDNIVNKYLDLKKARETVFFLKSIDVNVHGTFTFGLPGETAEQMADTQDYIASMPMDTYQTSGCAEINGTPLAELRRKGELKKYSGAKVDEDYIASADASRKLKKMGIAAQYAN